ncbi:MAG: hypothetical protein M1831_004400 [Alyxoria varia]|nr:MAG: hypothetical protein M1831_004400 [Alyxoria varia]
MAADSKTQTSMKVDRDQTIQACRVLLNHTKDLRKRADEKRTKPDLLAADAEDDEGEEARNTPLWMSVTTKKHIVANARLKPGKISLPHSIHTGSSSTICLITADPQRLYKDAIDNPSFPADLRSRVTRVIGLEKLKAKFKSFEPRRRLYAEHDVFLADSRIVTFLPKILGKVFYKGGAKRPIPVEIVNPPERGADGKKIKRPPGQVRRSTKGTEGKGAAPPETIARELRKALTSALVHLSPGVTTSIKFARADFDPVMCAGNIEAVLEGLTTRFITKGWQNVRAVHIKSPRSSAFPIWMTDELWVEDEDVLEEKKVQGKKKLKSLEAKEQPDGHEIKEAEKEVNRAQARGNSESDKHAKRKREAKSDNQEAAATAARKETLKKQKMDAMAQIAVIQG